MSLRRTAPFSLSAAAGGAAIASLAVMALVLPDTDRLLQGSIGEALARSDAGSPVAVRSQNVARARAAEPDVFDPSGLRLSRFDGHARQTGTAAAFAVGSRISITGPDGVHKALEVIDSRALDPQVTRVDDGQSGFLMVSARVVGDPKSLVRFIIEADDPVTARPGKAGPPNTL